MPYDTILAMHDLDHDDPLVLLVGTACKQYCSVGAAVATCYRVGAQFRGDASG